jgi:hypothetical protein
MTTSARGKNLDARMTRNGIDEDFTVIDVPTLNRYFRDYYLEHGGYGAMMREH